MLRNVWSRYLSMLWFRTSRSAGFLDLSFCHFQFILQAFFLSQLVFWLVVAGKAQVFLITLTKSLVRSNVPVRRDGRHNTLKLKQPNVIQPLLMLLVTPVLSPLWHVQMSVGKKQKACFCEFSAVNTDCTVCVVLNDLTSEFSTKLLNRCIMCVYIVQVSVSLCVPSCFIYIQWEWSLGCTSMADKRLVKRHTHHGIPVRSRPSSRFRFLWTGVRAVTPIRSWEEQLIRQNEWEHLCGCPVSVWRL